MRWRAGCWPQGPGSRALPEDATHILLNTCGFITDAKEESIAAILEACGDYEDRQVLVMGCLVERYREELQKGIPEVAGWFGLMDDAVRTARPDPAGRRHPGWRRHPGADSGIRRVCGVARTSGIGGKEVLAPDADGGLVRLPEDLRWLRPALHLLRHPGDQGAAIDSVDSAHILEEADACLAEGARELVLVGQDTALWKDASSGPEGPHRSACRR